MILSICCMICIVCLWVVIYLQGKDIDRLQESIYNLTVINDNSVKLWDRQVNINSSVTKFMSDITGVNVKEK